MGYVREGLVDQPLHWQRSFNLGEMKVARCSLLPFASFCIVSSRKSKLFI